MLFRSVSGSKPGPSRRFRLLKGAPKVAIKVIEVDEEDTSGFADEVLVLSKFRHPNLVTLMGWGSGLDEDGCGRRYLVYELLEGGDVAGRLAKARGKNGVTTPFGWAERLWVAAGRRLWAVAHAQQHAEGLPPGHQERQHLVG